MTDQIPTFTPTGTGYPMPPKRRRRWPWVVLGGLVLVIVLSVALGGNDTPAPGQVGTGTPGTTSAAPVAAVATQTPTVADFTLTATITSQQCFGSAGCDIEWTVRAAANAVGDNWPDTFTLTYEIAGIDGGYTGSIEFTNGGKQYSQLGLDGFGQTASKVTTLTATPTGVVAS